LLDQLRETSPSGTCARHDGFGDEVVEALQTLHPDFREAVELVDLRDLSYQDAAERLSCPIGTVMSRLHRGRKRLREALEGYAIEQGVLRPAA
jgi:RNA polymerase sigma-70 factor (ECF subfamily)